MSSEAMLFWYMTFVSFVFIFVVMLPTVRELYDPVGWRLNDEVFDGWVPFLKRPKDWHPDGEDIEEQESYELLTRWIMNWTDISEEDMANARVANVVDDIASEMLMNVKDDFDRYYREQIEIVLEEEGGRR